MIETEQAMEPGQRCYQSYSSSAWADCAWPLWSTLKPWERQAWANQEAAERWRETVQPLEGGSHER